MGKKCGTLGAPTCAQAFELSFLGLSSLSFFLERRLFVKPPVLQFPEETVRLHFPLEQPQRFFQVPVVDSYLQLSDFLPPPRS